MFLLGVLAGGGAPCTAQETITFEVRFSDPVLTPGETQGIEVWAILAPSHGAVVPWNTNGGTGQPGVVVGFGGASFDLRNVANGETGGFSDLQLNPAVGWWQASVGTPAGTGHVIGIVAHQPNLTGAFYGPNPLMVWRATWTPTLYEPREVRFATLVSTGPYAYLDIGLSAFAVDTWAAVNPTGSFTVVPAPGTVSVLTGLTVLLFPRRRGVGGGS